MEKWTVKRLLEWSITYFEKNKVQNPKMSSEMLLAEVMGFKRIDLYLNYSKMLNPDELSRYREFVKKRAEHQPVQYIINKAYFRDLTLYVDPSVLVPRPETEVLVDRTLEISSGLIQEGNKPNILEIGTGSGAIAISLEKELEGDFKIIATEKYKEALDVARKNAADNLGQDRGKRIDFYNADIIPDDVGFREKYSKNIDIIVSNPPYISEKNFKDLPREIREFEPPSSLLGGRDGTDFYERILSLCKGMLQHENGYMIFETDPYTYGKIIGLADDILDSPEIEISKDYTGRQRVAIIKTTSK